MRLDNLFYNNNYVLMKKLFLLFFLSLIILLGIKNIHSYLSLSNPVHAEILLVEGWIGDTYAPKILEDFYRNHYSRIVIIGTRKPKMNGNITNDTQSNAVILRKKLRSLSNNTIIITLINSIYVNKHQTFNYLVSFKNWLMREIPDIESVNLFSVSLHARKSYLILRRVLPSSIEVGVISATPIHYDAQYWWLSKRGIWLVFKNTISFINAYIFENCQYLAC